MNNLILIKRYDFDGGDYIMKFSSRISMSDEHIEELKEILKEKEIEIGEEFYFEKLDGDNEIDLLFVVNTGDIVDGKKTHINTLARFKINNDKLYFIQYSLNRTQIAQEEFTTQADNFNFDTERDLFEYKTISPVKLSSFDKAELDDYMKRWNINY